jgi:hypothetical protein
MNLPQMVRIRQEFKTNPIRNIAQTVQAELAKIKIQDTIRSGDRVAITAGSRGIANLPRGRKNYWITTASMNKIWEFQSNPPWRSSR